MGETLWHYRAQFLVNKKQFQPLLEALCYHPQDISPDNIYAFVMTEFSSFNFAVTFNQAGNLNKIELISTPEGDIDDLLVPIAPYVEPTSFIECAFRPSNQYLANNEIAVIRWEFSHQIVTSSLYAIQHDYYSQQEVSRRLVPNLHIAA
ncbi:hypothetical protein [Spartinivicinus poritis]|uniref:Uncharacterized protein n=1 Tax=Spartinivicinus poritis TaxID=2994640 RepID=A0ABT5U8Q7_9GAMM|nr:hypothetical protein [Spartinivicinus sp. A2-2]MDE1462391.1 hypothetical protein [Spartinivicinus sp. A2-2]